MLPEQSEIKLIELFKICTKCKIPKLLKHFSKHKKCCFAVNSVCKVCEKLRVRKWYKENPEKGKKANKRWATNNAKKKQKSARKWYRKNLVLTRERSRKWHKDNPEKVKVISKRCYQKNRKNTSFVLSRIISSGIWFSLKGNKNGRKWENLVGYTLNNLKSHIEKQFKDGMTWENYGKGGWEIDHKIPKLAFNFTQPEHIDFKRCWALKNLQPMWAKENNFKRAKIEHHFQPSLLL